MIGPSIHLLDTNTTTYVINGRSPAAREKLVATRGSGRVAVSVITEAELLFGLENKPGAIHLRTGIELLLKSVEILPWDSAAALAYSKLRTRMNAMGKSLAPYDMLIAAHALSTGAVLVTHDKAFLHAAPFLDVVDWATDL